MRTPRDVQSATGPVDVFSRDAGFVVSYFGFSELRLSVSQRGFSQWVDVSLLLVGAGVAAVSALQFRTVVRGLGDRRRLDSACMHDQNWSALDLIGPIR